MRYGMIAVLAAALLAGGSEAQARDVGQWAGQDEAIARWFSELKQPDNPDASCCGEADGYWADTIEVHGDQVIAVITDDRPDEPLRRPHVPIGTRIVVPPNKLKFDRGNPTGHAVIFLGADLIVWCFVQNGGV